MTELNTDEYYAMKRFFAWLFAPFWIALVVGFISTKVPEMLGWSTDWATHAFVFFKTDTLKSTVIALSIMGLLMSWIPAASSLLRESKLPVPGLTWIPNPLYSVKYKVESPTGDANILIEEGKQLKADYHEALFFLNYHKSLDETHVRTITNIKKLQRSMRNRLLDQSKAFDIKDFLNEIAIEICSSMIDETADKSCSIMIVEDDLLKIWGQSRIDPDSKYSTAFEHGKGFAGSIWETGTYDIVDDTNSDSRFRTSTKRYYSSIIGVPVVIWGNVIGVICVQSEKNSAFCQEDGGILSGFAELILLAMTIDQQVACLRQCQATNYSEAALTIDD